MYKIPWIICVRRKNKKLNNINNKGYCLLNAYNLLGAVVSTLYILSLLIFRTIGFFDEEAEFREDN